MWYGKNSFRDEDPIYASNDEWAPTTVIIQKKCECKNEAEIAKLKEELETHFEKVLSE